MLNLVQDLIKLNPEESAKWALRQALHSPPPAMPGQTVPQQSPLPVNATPVSTAANFGAVVNPVAAQGVAAAGVNAAPAAYMAPAPVLTPEQQKLLAAQGARVPVPKMPVQGGGALAHYTPAQTNTAGIPTRAPAQARASLAQLLGG